MALKTPFILTTLLVAQASWASDAVTEFDTPDTHVMVVRPLERWTGNTDLMEKSLKAVTQHTGCFYNLLKTDVYKDSSCKNFFGSMDTPDSKLVVGTFDQISKIEPKFEYSTPNSGNYLIIQPVVSLTPEEFNVFKKAQDFANVKQKIDDGDPDTLEGRAWSSRAFQTLVQVALTATVMNNSSLGAQNGFMVANNIGVPEAAKALAPRVGSALAPVSIPALADPSAYQTVDVRRLDVVRPGLGQIVIAYRNPKTPENELAALSQAIAIALAPKGGARAVQDARDADLVDRKQFWISCKSDPDCSKGAK